MARTKQTARRSTGGRCPRHLLPTRTTTIQSVSSEEVIQELFVANIQELRSMYHHTFEKLCGKVFQTQYGGNIKVSKVGPDNGVDVILQKQDLIDGYTKLVIQCKRYARGNNISISALDRHMQVIRNEGGTKGFFCHYL